MNSESSLHYSVQKILADNVSVRGWLVSTNWDQTLHGFVLARMTRHPMKFARQPPFSVYSCFISYSLVWRNGSHFSQDFSGLKSIFEPAWISAVDHSKLGSPKSMYLTYIDLMQST